MKVMFPEVQKDRILRFAAVAAFFCAPFALHAQSTQGTILGTVTDASGAVVPNATVKVTNTDAGVSRTVNTDKSGNYEVLDLSAGHYAVSIVAAGFDGENENNLTLVARQQLRANATLHVGAVAQQVEISAATSGAINTETPSIDATLTAIDVENLPANYRASISGTSPLNLIQTLPGVQADTGKSNGTGVQFSVQGGLPSQSDTTVDGISAQSTTGNSPLANAFPSGESISEVRVDGVLNNAEYGQPGEVTFVSKSGTNKLHGAAFLYDQNSAFDATPYGSIKPHIRGNDFGGTIGGPVFIPHLYNGHDKSFFFATYEGFRLPSTTTQQALVPSTLMKQGNFNGVGTVVNPFAGFTPYANDTIPVNAASQKFLQFFPDPNLGDPTVYSNSGYKGLGYNYIVSKANTYNSNQFDVRGDQYLGKKALVFARYTWKNINQVQPEPLNFPSGTNTGQDRVLVLAANYSFTSNLVNEFRFGFTLDTTGTANGFNGQGFTNGTGLQGLQNLGFFNGVSELDFKNLTSFNPDRLNSSTKSRLFQYNDAITWAKGHHTLKAGVDIRHLEAVTPLGFYGADNYGTFGFNTGNTFTGQEFGDFLAGIPQYTAYDVVNADNDGTDWHYSFYTQDEWKTTPRLNITLGVRYDLQPGYHDASGNIGNFNPAIARSGEAIFPDGAQATLNAGFLASFNACPVGQTTGTAAANGAPCTPVLTNSQAGLPNGLRTTEKYRVMPRIGFAYRPFNNTRTAIRGGFGMYSITSLGSSFYSLTGTLQSGTTIYPNSATASGPAYSFPQSYAGAGTSSNAAQLGTAYFGTANDINWKDPYSEQFTLSVDQEIGKGYGARVSYIGMESHDLVWAPDLNQLPATSSTVSAYNQPLSAHPFPNFGTINTRSTGANASYQSMQVDFNHRATKGLTFDSTYTLAKNTADNQGPNSSSFAGEAGGARASWAFNRSIDFGNVYGTRRNRWSTTLVYQLPYGRGKQFGSSIGRVQDALLGGWQVSSIFLWQSGPFLTPYFAGGEGDPSGTGSGLSKSAAGGSYSARAQLVDQVGAAKPTNQGRNNWVNKASFVCPGNPTWTPGTNCTTGSGSGPVPLPIGRFGNAPVGSIIGPGTVNLSTGLSKSFAITEGVKLRAEGTFTNVLNHTNLADPQLDISSANFGVITSARGSDFGGARSGQVSVRVEF
jgi:hypothetical protein